MPATPGTIDWKPTASTWGRASDSSAGEGGWTRNIRSRSRRRSRMSIEARYHEQVRLLVALLPFLNDEPCFALKGGTAINLFVQPFPRLSVDDVKLLLDQGGLDRSVFEGFLVYLLGHPRSVNEVINRRIKPLEAIYRKEFVGMAITDISLPQLEAVRHRLLERLAQLFTDDDARFLLSFKKGEPDWSLFPVQGVDQLAAVMWKLANIRKMGAEKHGQALEALDEVLRKLRC